MYLQIDQKMNNDMYLIKISQKYTLKIEIKTKNNYKKYIAFENQS